MKNTAQKEQLIQKILKKDLFGIFQEGIGLQPEAHEVLHYASPPLR